jgi:hypothetical protein
VATVCLNVATGSFSKSCISVERSNKLQFLQHISLNCGNTKETVATKVANVATGTFLVGRRCSRNMLILGGVSNMQFPSLVFSLFQGYYSKQGKNLHFG